MSYRTIPAAVSSLVITFAIGAVVAAQAAKPDLPLEVSKALTYEYPHWTLATVTPPPAASCAAASSAAAPILRGDFNGDGIQDVAVQIQAGAATHVVMVLNRSHDPVIVDMNVPVGPLVVHHIGERYTVPGRLLDSYYLSDTIGTDICGDGDVWVWSGSSFEKTHVKH